MKPNLRLFTDPIFLLSLAILVLNDWVLKYQFGGFVTGKLSDVSGLFAFSFFWSVFFARHRLAVYILTAIMFTFWKLPVSEDCIHFINQHFRTGFNRVVDYTDLFTLLILPVSYAWFNFQSKKPRQQISNSMVIPILISAFSIVAFSATSMLTGIWSVEYKKINEVIFCQEGKEKIFKNFIQPKGELKYALEDTVFRITHMTTTQAGIQARTWVRIYPLDTTQTMFVLDSIELNRPLSGWFGYGKKTEDANYLQKIKRKDLIADFRKNVIDQIVAGKMLHSVYAENPKRDTIRSAW